MEDIIFFIIMCAIVICMTKAFSFASSVTEVRNLKKIDLFEKSGKIGLPGMKLQMNAFVCEWKNKIFEIRAFEKQLLIVSGNSEDVSLGFEEITPGFCARVFPQNDPMRIFLVISKTIYKKRNQMAVIAEMDNKRLLFTETHFLAKKFGFIKVGDKAWACWVPKEDTAEIIGYKTKVGPGRFAKIMLKLYPPEKKQTVDM